MVSIPIQINNNSHNRLSLYAEVDLPNGLSTLTSQNRFIHLNGFQIINETLCITLPDCLPPGQYPFVYRLISENNVNLNIVSEGLIVVEAAEEQPCWIQTEEHLDASPNEMVFISTLIQNPYPYPVSCKLKMKTPEGWQIARFSDEQIQLEGNASSLHIIGVKIPASAVAQEYQIGVQIEGERTLDQKCISVSVNPVLEFSARLILDRTPTALACENRGNTPLELTLSASTEPLCPLILSQDRITLPPFETIEVPFELDLEQSQDEEQQFVLFQFFGSNQEEPLFQIPHSFPLVIKALDDDDPFVRIPSVLRTTVLGENQKTVGVIEVSGRGVYDEEKQRSIDYCIRLPTDQKNVIYSIDQRLYVGLKDPFWALDLGDTVYALTPLTQYYRWGRGAGFEASSTWLSCGLHYTENTFNNDYNPKEMCAFAAFTPTDNWNLSGNYLHKVLSGNPTSHIFTLESEMEPIPNISLEIEAGNNFLDKKTDHDTRAFRVETRGRLWKDYWFDIEKVYAGTDFLGYYQAMNLFSSTLDSPIYKGLRGNLSFTSLRQNYGSLDPNDPASMSPRQKQGSAELTYSFQNGLACSVNGLLLRAKEVGICEEYDFYQKWCGFNLLSAQNGYLFNANCSLGQQKDYLTGKTSHCLQRYYTYFGKDLSDFLSASCFYEAGHIDYFDVKPWRTSYGASFRYRYKPGCWCDLYLQKVNHKHENYQLSQVSFNLHHQLRNRHSIDLSFQRFFYANHYPSDSFFLISYSIPFGLKLMEKGDRGDLEGSLYDSWNNIPISNALVNLNGRQAKTDAQGKFYFPRTAVGTHTLKTDYLPGNLTSQDTKPGEICIQKGKMNETMLHCLPAVTIEGSVILYGFSEDNPFSIEAQLIELQGLQGIRVSIDLENGKEIYTCITDRKGKFRFPKLRPGSWRIYINTDQIPKLHSLNMNDFNLELKPGETKELSLKITPEKRIMQSL